MTPDPTPIPGLAPRGNADLELAPTWQLDDATLPSLLAACAAIEAAHPGTRALATFDQGGQAEYTSHHALHAFDLDSPEGHDLSPLPPKTREIVEEEWRLVTPACFPFRLANLHRHHADKAPDGVPTLRWVCHTSRLTLAEANADPAALLDKRVWLWAVPTDRAADALAIFPNGYFGGDWSPAATLTVARALEPLGAALTAIGASYLMFRLSPDADRAALSATLAAYYADADRATLQAALTGDTLLARYTD